MIGSNMLELEVWPADWLGLVHNKSNKMISGMSVRLIFGAIVAYYIRKNSNVRYTL
jgi:hypothetical protein